MKRNRIIWCLLWILSIVGISFFGGPVSYGFFVLMTIIPIMSLIYLLCVKVCFHIYQELDTKRLVVDQPVPFFFTLMNESFFGFSGLKVKFFSAFSSISGLDSETVYELLPGTGVRLETGLLCRYRGEYEVGIQSVEMQDYFRLFCLSFRNPEPLRVMVKPKLVYLDRLRSVDVVTTVSHRAVNEDTEPDVLVRRYEPGDDIRQMHWNLSARNRQLMIRTRTGEEQQGVSILMGTERNGQQQESIPVENKMLETALAFSLYFAGHNIPVRVLTLQERLCERDVDGMEQFESLYRGIADVEFRKEYAEAIFLENAVKSGSVFSSRLVFLVLQEWSETTQEVLRMLLYHHVAAVLCLVTKDGKMDTCPGIPDGVGLIRIDPDADLKEVL